MILVEIIVHIVIFENPRFAITHFKYDFIPKTNTICNLLYSKQRNSKFKIFSLSNDFKVIEIKLHKPRAFSAIQEVFA